MRIDRQINREAEAREIHQHPPNPLVANKAATPLREMCTEAVEGFPQRRNVKGVPDEHVVAVEGDDGRALAVNGGKRVASHVDAAVRPVVGNER